VARLISSSFTDPALAHLVCWLAALSLSSLAGATGEAGNAVASPRPVARVAMLENITSTANANPLVSEADMCRSDNAHAGHRAMLAQPGYQRSEHAYPLRGDYRLAGMNGEETSLQKELDTENPVMVNFIFTTCTTICPVMSGVFAEVQKQLGPAGDGVRMISITIDPEHDTPERLRDYAQRFRAGPQWRFLTGEPIDIIAVQKAFGVYRGNKMSHEPTTLLRRSKHDPWIRLDGIASTAEMVAEYRKLAAR
jgi:protein SCO1/2